jgi:hypothetical protein
MKCHSFVFGRFLLILSAQTAASEMSKVVVGLMTSLKKARPEVVMYFADRYPTVRWPRSPQQSTRLGRTIRDQRVLTEKAKGDMMEFENEEYSRIRLIRKTA